jgi:hypothetical protein
MLNEDAPPSFLHFQQCVSIPKVRVGGLIAFTSTEGQVIFQQVGSGYKHQDGKRIQIVGINILNKNRKSYQPITTFVAKLIEAVDPNLELSPESVIVSTPKCMEQSFHADYDYDTPAAKKSFIILAGLMPSKLNYVDVLDGLSIRKTLAYDAGDILIARGDFVHAGAAYDQSNVRLHFYVDPPRDPLMAPARILNKTYIVSDDQGFFSFAYYTQMNNFINMCKQVKAKRKSHQEQCAKMRATKKTSLAPSADLPAPDESVTHSI